MPPASPDAPLILCLGQVVIDHTFKVAEIPHPPAKETARDYQMSIGGLAANASIAVARLGGRARFWGRIGDDRDGDPVVTALNEEGIDTTSLRREKGGRSAVSAVLVDQVGERVTLTYRGANLDNDPSWLPLEQMAEARALLTDPRWPEGAAAALGAARAQGVPSILDGERSEARLLHMLVPLAAHCIFSETGMRIFAGGGGPAEGLRRAMVVGVGAVAAVTRGERSTLWIARGSDAIRETPSFPVQASNTSGAGDVFHGAYALAIAEGQPPEQAMRFASAAGACRARDGVTPHRAELEAMLA